MKQNNRFNSFLRALPKCEHHIHLEGTLSPTLLFRLSAKHGIALPNTPSYISAAALAVRYQDFSSLDDFLNHYYVAMSVLLTVDDFADLAYEYLISTYDGGVRHVEMFFDPQAHIERGIPYDVIVEGIEKGVNKAKTECKGLSVLLIACFLRHMGGDEAMEMLDLMEHDLKSKRIVGVGLDSSEKGFGPELFVQVYKKARSWGAMVTAHAGEECPSDAITRTLNLLHTTRIDHGLTSWTDEALLKRLREENIMLSLCPLSNVCLKGIKDLSEFPVRTWLDNKVKFSVNGDDPAYFRGGVLKNCQELQKTWTLSASEWEWIVSGSIDGSWCEEERKEVLRRQLAIVVKEYAGVEWMEKEEEEDMVKAKMSALKVEAGMGIGTGVGRSMEEIENEVGEDVVVQAD